MSLQDFSRRLGVSYDDLSSIIQTQFINPNAILIPGLQRLNVPFTTLHTLNEKYPADLSLVKTFIDALPAGLDATQYGGVNPIDYQAVVNWVIKNYPLITDIITISTPTDSSDACSGAAWQLRYLNPDNTENLLSGTDFVKLIRFIRLWQKLAPLLGDADNSVSIAQTDAILTALYPVDIRLISVTLPMTRRIGAARHEISDITAAPRVPLPGDEPPIPDGGCGPRSVTRLLGTDRNRGRKRTLPENVSLADSFAAESRRPDGDGHRTCDHRRHADDDDQRRGDSIPGRNWRHALNDRGQDRGRD